MNDGNITVDTGVERDWPADGRGAMAIMSLKGDTKIFWDKNNEDEIANARRTFNDLKKKGYAAFRLVGNDRGEQIHEFEASADRMIMVPPMKGG